jgi:hypothetical protein
VNKILTFALWGRRLLVGLVLFAVVFMIAGGFLVKACGQGKPSIAAAPWFVQTSTRFYYAKEYSLQDGVPSIQGYWTLDGKKYRYYNFRLLFEPISYGKVKVMYRGVLNGAQ